MAYEFVSKALVNRIELESYDPGFEYEDRFYMHNPTFDILLFDGSKLKDGMLVMIGEPALRAHTPLVPTMPRFEAELYKAKVFNRWCYVSDLVIEPATVMFIGTYEDGVQVKHTHDINHAWIVRRSSMRQPLYVYLEAGSITQEEYDAALAEVDLIATEIEELAGSQSQILQKSWEERFTQDEEMRQKVMAGEITDVDYAAWKAERIYKEDQELSEHSTPFAQALQKVNKKVAEQFNPAKWEESGNPTSPTSPSEKDDQK